MSTSRKDQRDNASPRLHGDEAMQEQERAANENYDNRTRDTTASDTDNIDYDDEVHKENQIRRDEIESEEEND